MIIAVILTFIVATYFFFKNAEYSFDYGFGVFLAALAASMIGLVFGFTGWLIATSVDTPYHVSERLPIVSLREESEIKGSFVLGSGYINGSPSYIYYTNPAPNSYQEHTVDSSKVLVVEDSTVETANIITFQHDPWGSIWLLGGTDDHFKVELHVPPGTIYKQLLLGQPPK